MQAFFFKDLVVLGVGEEAGAEEEMEQEAGEGSP
jgi:hypothetical protein